jgi:thiol-disulfide isomerase/thioredoxin
MDWTAEMRAVLSGLTAERDPLVRQARLLQVVVLASFGAKIPPAIGAQALREIPPSAAMWRSGASLRYAAPLVAQQLADSTLSLWRFSRGVALTAGDSARMRADAAAVAALMERLVANTQDPRTRASFIATAIEVTNKWQPATFERLMSVMQTEYADRQGTAEILRRFSANRLLRVGVDMPSFNLRTLGNDSVSITNQTVKGRFTLVDFWATWCAPCLSEMPDLHEAYDKFSSRGFQILSISADASPSVVTRFREKWPMPWMHGFVKGALESDELRALQINSLPRALLLDPAGRIVAMDGELRGAALKATLERLLAASGK